MSNTEPNPSEKSGPEFAGAKIIYMPGAQPATVEQIDDNTGQEFVSQTASMPADIFQYPELRQGINHIAEVDYVITRFGLKEVLAKYKSLFRPIQDFDTGKVREATPRDVLVYLTSIAGAKKGGVHKVEEVASVFLDVDNIAENINDLDLAKINYDIPLPDRWHQQGLPVEGCLSRANIAEEILIYFTSAAEENTKQREYQQKSSALAADDAELYLPFKKYAIYYNQLAARIAEIKQELEPSQKTYQPLIDILQEPTEGLEDREALGIEADFEEFMHDIATKGDALVQTASDVANNFRESSKNHNFDDLDPLINSDRHIIKLQRDSIAAKQSLFEKQEDEFKHLIKEFKDDVDFVCAEGYIPYVRKIQLSREIAKAKQLWGEGVIDRNFILSILMSERQEFEIEAFAEYDRKHPVQPADPRKQKREANEPETVETVIVAEKVDLVTDIALLKNEVSQACKDGQISVEEADKIQSELNQYYDNNLDENLIRSYIIKTRQNIQTMTTSDNNLLPLI